jgi:hypothetical protein
MRIFSYAFFSSLRVKLATALKNDILSSGVSSRNQCWSSASYNVCTDYIFEEQGNDHWMNSKKEESVTYQNSSLVTWKNRSLKK